LKNGMILTSSLIKILICSNDDISYIISLLVGFVNCFDRLRHT
jgi:hypothetical protein